jgi:hypothetical protein
MAKEEEKSKKAQDGIRVQSEEQEKLSKKDEKNLQKQIIVMLLILGLILISILAAYEIFKPKAYFKYNDFTVKRARFGNSSSDMVFYLIPIPGTNENALLTNDPRKINVSINANVSALFNGIHKIWITMPPDLGSEVVAAAHELEVLTSRIGYITNFGLTNYSETDENLTREIPIITCENATNSTRVFMLDVGDETKVYANDYCIIIQGENYKELMKATEALILEWLYMIEPTSSQ